MVNVYDAQSMLSAVTSDLFSVDKAKAHAEFRMLGKIWHPDVCTDPKATEVFSHIVSLYSLVGTVSTKSKKQSSVNFGSGVTFEYAYEADFEMGKVYIGKSDVAYAFNKSHADKATRAMRTIKEVDNYIRASPKLSSMATNVVETATACGNDTLIWKSGVPSIYRLSDLSRALPDLDVKHAAWIISRLMNFACLVCAAGYSHNGLVLDNCWVDPASHRILILGGWQYAEKLGMKLREVNSEIYGILPFSVKTSKKAESKIDIEAVKEIGRKITSGRSLPEPFKEWLWGANKESPYDEFAEWDKALIASFGARKFVELTVDERIIFG